MLKKIHTYLLATALLAIASCKKTYCWECKTRVYTNSKAPSDSSKSVFCDKKSDEMDDYARDKTKTYTVQGVRVSMVTTCSKQ